MAYRLRYTFNVDFVGAGMGPIGSPPLLPSGGNAQTFGGVNQLGGQNVAGAGAGNIINAADITTLTNAMAADVAAQLNVPAVLAKLQGFNSGQP